MKDPLDILSEKVEEMKVSINPTIQRTFEQYKDLIVEFNADKQMFQKGEDSKGSIIRPAYKPITIKLKRKKGQPTDRVTLRDTGRFHRGLKVIPHEEYVEIISDVDYAKYLFKKYGDDILGIQEELLKEFVNNYVLRELQKEIYDKLTKS